MSVLLPFHTSYCNRQRGVVKFDKDEHLLVFRGLL
uniref:Uncharacterized protein n=1 Tax=Myoviridae sp. ctbwh6 TaxID=2827611 RepID=A0A8S5LHQ3_9CAUD|nr:MAG TPA: hypothetical protein [Myoviridae sp. ctbwh6]